MVAKFRWEDCIIPGKRLEPVLESQAAGLLPSPSVPAAYPWDMMFVQKKFLPDESIRQAK